MTTATQFPGTLPTISAEQKIDDEPRLDFKRQTKYFLRCLKTYLPTAYTGNDSNRMSLAFFTICGLDLLGQLKTNTTAEERKDYVDWIYKNQHPKGGFRAFPGTEFGDRAGPQNEAWDPANLPATFFAMCLLLILEDDFSRFKRQECLDWLPKLQRENGGFGETLVDGAIQGGTDSRFGYCGAGVRYMLAGDVPGTHKDINVDSLVKCINASETYDGGIADSPFHEAHAGFTFCGVGILSFLNRLSPALASTAQGHTTTSNQVSGPSNPAKTLHWLVSRQTATINEDDDFDTHGDETDTAATCHDAHSFVHIAKSQRGKESYASRPSSRFELDWTGFNGRCNKIADTCYAFWVGGALSILGYTSFPSHGSLRRWLLERTVHLALGGFGKHAGDLPDVYHSSLALAALSLMGEKGLKPLDPTMCISHEAKKRLETVWRSWGVEKSVA